MNRWVGTYNASAPATVECPEKPKRAAEELCVTRGAVSHHVKALEA